MRSLHSFTFFWKKLKWQEILSRTTSVVPPGWVRGHFFNFSDLKQNLTELEKWERRDSQLHCPPPGCTWKVSFCTLYLWKALWLPTTEREDLQITLSDEKSSSFFTEGPLSPPDYSLSGQSFIFESVKGQVQSSDSLHPGLQSDMPKAQCISAWKLTIFSHVFDLASDTAMASRWGFKTHPCVYTRQSSVNYPLCIFPERPHSLPLRSLR